MAIDYYRIIQQVWETLEQGNNYYKLKANNKQHFKQVHLKDLVMVCIHKERFPLSTYSKLKPWKLGPFSISKKINDNAYTLALPLDLNLNSTFNIADI